MGKCEHGVEMGGWQCEVCDPMPECYCDNCGVGYQVGKSTASRDWDYCCKECEDAYEAARK